MTEELKPKRAKKIKQSDTTTITSLSAANEDFINNLLQTSLNRYKNSADKEFVEHKQDIEHLKNMLSEYLEDFIVIGHTPDDRRVVLRHAPTARGYDALKELSREYIIKTLSQDRLDDRQPGNQ